MRSKFPWWMACWMMSAWGLASAEAPRLYHSAGLQSPVQAGADDLLLLAGFPLSPTDRVVYRVDDGRADWPRGSEVPAASGAREGLATVVAPASDRQALVVRLPAAFDSHRDYLLAINRDGEWSNPVRVNDVRPFWLSPAVMPASGAPPGLSRQLKVIGRNLANDAAVTQVRLRGPAEFTLRARVSATRGLDTFVTQVNLPASMPVGNYTVSVSRDGQHWSETPLPLRVFAPAPAGQELSVAEPRFGGCHADDGRDDTACLIAAIATAAKIAGTVRFPPGTWLIDEPDTAGVAEGEGILLPRGVGLRGDATRASRMERGSQWYRHGVFPSFVLLGDNHVEALTFIDHDRQRNRVRAKFLQLGRTWYRVKDPAQRLIDGIRIVDNRFTGAEVAVSDGGLPLRNLVITNNDFAAWRMGLSLGGDANNLRDVFRIEDAIVTHNRFEPGSYLDLRERQGTRAAEFGAGTRVDFSDNVADGVSHAGLDNPGDARGWRAAFFWHLGGPQEHLLISNNLMTCTGDKAGDGEGIALDNTHNGAVFEAARAVLAADAHSVTVLGPVNTRADGRAVPAPDYFVGRWLQVSEGPGLGQSRRVAGIHYDAGTRRTRLSVEPAWDVPPLPGSSRVTAARVFWQTYVVGNRIDHRAPPCLKSNRTAPKGGSIAIWAQTSDSVVANNQQFDTDGIVFHQSYAPGATSFNAFLEIRNNELRGEYDRTRDAADSGIRGPHGAARDAPPPVESFGVTIAHNVIDGADATGGAGIHVPLSWYDGPAPHGWPLLDRLLIYGNSIRATRLGIEIPVRAQVRRAVLHANKCEAVRSGARVSGATALCVTPAPDSCECRRED